MEPLDKAAGFSLRPSELEVAIIDYGMGNLRSVQKALETVGAGKVSVVTEPGEITHKPMPLFCRASALSATR